MGTLMDETIKRFGPWSYAVWGVLALIFGVAVGIAVHVVLQLVFGCGGGEECVSTVPPSLISFCLQVLQPA